MLNKIKKSHIYQKIFSSNHPLTKVIKTNLYSSFLIKIVSLLVSLLNVPLLYSVLGKEEYGIFLAISSVFNWLIFFDVGLTGGLRNRLGEARAKSNLTLAKEYVSSSYFLLLGIFTSLFCIYFVLSSFFDLSYLLIPKIGNRPEIQILMNVVMLSVCFRFVFQAINAILYAYQKSFMPGLIGLISNILSFGVLYIMVLFRHPTLLEVGSILAISPVLILLIFNIILFNTGYSSISPQIKFIRLKHYKSIFNLGYKFFIIQISGIVIYQTTNFLIINLFSAGDVTNYNISQRYFSIFTMVFGMVITPFWGAITESYFKEDILWIKTAMRKLRYLAFMVMFFLVGSLLISQKVINLWLGNNVDIPFKVLFAVFVLSVFYIFFSPYASFLNGVGKVKLNMILVAIQIFLFFPMVWIFIKLFHFGVEGIIYASLITEMPIRISQPIQYHKIINNTATGIWNA